MTAVSWSLVMVPSSTSGSSAWVNMALMSGGWPPPGAPVAAAWVVVADPDESPHAARPSPAAVATARIRAATATATIGLRISHLFVALLLDGDGELWRGAAGRRAGAAC